ncbi:MAG TPA: CarD family transcriptional regulator [Bacillota bacterium]|nr:CarD family transcriptional regulator [Bacillota bacterium]
MFQVGEKIFYPLLGAGIVESIEEKEVLGAKESYYIFNMILRNLQVMIPVRKADNLVIREVVDLEILDNAVAMFHGEHLVPTVPYQERRRINIDKMKSGDIFGGVEVILDLMLLNSQKKLNVEDKTMLDNAKQMLISELVVVKGLNTFEAEKLLNRATITSM